MKLRLQICKLFHISVKIATFLFRNTEESDAKFKALFLHETFRFKNSNLVLESEVVVVVSK